MMKTKTRAQVDRWWLCLCAALGVQLFFASGTRASDAMRPPGIASSAVTQASGLLRGAVESGEVAGAMHLVVHAGREVHFEKAGVRDIEDGLPMERNTLVRIYSMTKPIVSVAAMTLYEQGKFDLDDPVSKFIPAFGDTVAFVGAGASLKTEPLDRPITVRDVFRHTTGYAYGGGMPGREKAYRKERMHYNEPAGMMPPEVGLKEGIEALARIPVHHQPGKRFTYGFSTDLLGRLIEVWSGDTLENHLSEALFEPLQMSDTGFSIPEEKRSRFASCHTKREGKLAVLDKATTSPFVDGFPFTSGGGGLISTMDDYAKFCQMLVDGGVANGVNLLKPETLQMMFTNQLQDVEGDFQFGLGFAIQDIDVGKGANSRKVKQVSWGGYASTDFRVVPEEKLFQIFIRQQIPSAHQLAGKAFTAIYQGLERSEEKPEHHHEGSAPANGTVGWTGLLGPNRDGWVQDAPKSWPEKLHSQWKVDVGTGYGTPLAVDGKVYSHARLGEEEVVWCLDQSTGEVLWRQSYPVPFKMGGGGESHGKGPKSCPTIADGRLFTMSISGVLSAWQTSNGSLLWRKDYAAEFKKTHPYWGACTSPMVDGDRVMVHFGGDESGVLAAHHVESGELIWRQGDDGAAYASPLIAEIDGVRQLIEWNHRALVGVDVATGEKLWDQPFEHVGTNQNMPSPSLYQNTILVGGENRGFYCFAPHREGGRWSVEEKWFQDKVALDMSSAVVNGDRLYGFSHYGRGRLFCMDCETGEVLWQGPGRSGENVTFLSMKNYVVALMSHGELKVLRANDESQQEAQSYQVSETQTWAHPVLLPGGVLIKDKNSLAYWSFSESP